ncbi:Rv3654c family TadE-like protein [Arthrobacter pullicola]|uniref:Rv3654c family TadE-like protein n=1 Tax=Arthrobacter pullicola TaxID=2762224 RepID=UPI00296AFC75|nr:Rv3654c family TadE-like protein [Arthrobacter pullicola]
MVAQGQPKEAPGIPAAGTFRRTRAGWNPGQLRRDEGSGTVLSLGLCLAVITLLLALLVLAQATVGAARAGAAADLAALAGADAVRALRAGDPCTVAAEVVARNGAELISCAPDTGTRSITVEVASSAGRLLPWPSSARARAGPPG